MATIKNKSISLIQKGNQVMVNRAAMAFDMVIVFFCFFKII